MEWYEVPELELVRLTGLSSVFGGNLCLNEWHAVENYIKGAVEFEGIEVVLENSLSSRCHIFVFSLTCFPIVHITILLGLK